ncbi:MAG: exosortase H [Rubrivivax sp.]
MTAPIRSPLPRSPARFLSTFLLVAALGFALALSPWVIEQLLVPLAQALASVAALAVQAAGGSAEAQSATIRHEGGFAVTVVTRCIGVEAMILLGAGMVAFPARWHERCLGFTAGVLAIVTLNLLRIIGLYGVGPSLPALFEWGHLYSGDLFVMIPALVFFLLWIRWLPSRRRSSSSHAAAA